MPSLFGTETWQLPPLILHPFGRQAAPTHLIEKARATLLLSTLSPEDGRAGELNGQVLEGRLQELRMLYYLGKDLFRWMDQCVEWSARALASYEADISERSFAAYLVHRPPQGVRAKLETWGVSDYSAIFSRAIGLKAVFREPPMVEHLEPLFLKDYYVYADYLFTCYEQMRPFTEIGPENFPFEIFGSGEYSRILETQWEADTEPRLD
jgi:hypothetical protein